VRLGVVYTVAITLLALATPISVQVLINSVAFTAAPVPLWTLAGSCCCCCYASPG
jgi:putative ABC transport system ATP-binding protein